MKKQWHCKDSSEPEGKAIIKIYRGSPIEIGMDRCYWCYLKDPAIWRIFLFYDQWNKNGKLPFYADKTYWDHPEGLFRAFDVIDHAIAETKEQA